MSTINKQTLMMMGARSRLVEIESERLQILKMFPELDDERHAVAPEPPAKKRRATKGEKKRAPAKRTKAGRVDRMNEVALLVSRIERIDADRVAEEMDITRQNAHQLLSNARAKGIIKRIKPGIYGAAS